MITKHFFWVGGVVSLFFFFFFFFHDDCFEIDGRLYITLLSLVETFDCNEEEMIR